MAKVRPVPPWPRVAFRLPDQLYRHRLGFVLGRRLLRLVHVGRHSGRRYAAVLEVLRYDPRVPEFVVVSGFGRHADWLRNIEANGTAEVTAARRTFVADHRVLTLEEAVTVLADYEHRNRAIGPVVRRLLSWLLGWRYDGSPAARRRWPAQLRWSRCDQPAEVAACAPTGSASGLVRSTGCRPTPPSRTPGPGSGR